MNCARKRNEEVEFDKINIQQIGSDYRQPQKKTISLSVHGGASMEGKVGAFLGFWPGAVNSGRTGKIGREWY
jgi:hypothetical protein